MWGEEEQELSLIAQDCDFDRATARELFRISLGGDPHIAARWSRTHEEIEFVDVVQAIHGRADANGFISCPFHGRDARPSFKLYKGSNDAWCFGCPYGEQYYDSVGFIKAKYGFTPLQSIAWLEKRYDLPPLEIDDDDEDGDDDTEIVNLNFHHLAEPYIERAALAFSASLDPELAREYLAIYFAAVPARDASPDSEEELVKATPLARVLGWQAVERIKKLRLL